MPATLLATGEDGKETRITVPAEAWMKGNRTQFHLASTTKIRSLTLDPDHKLPDTDRSNNVINLH